MDKIISFSLWGQATQYTDGAIANAQMVPDFYPAWRARFYVDSEVPYPVIEQLQALGAEIIVMGKTDDCLGLYWRFHPMFDDANVERFIVRDTDSKFTKREVDAVNEWVESDLPFHIIRDNRSHNVPICGGMWGAKAGCIKDFQIKMGRWFSTLQPDMKNPRGKFFGSDQIFLAAMVWPIVRHNHMAHVMANEAGLLFTGAEKILPPLVDNHYVGMVC
jgi:hypothetical protein